MIRARWCQSNDARDISVYLAHKYCEVTNVRIGRELGGLSGAHVGYILKKVKNRLSRDRGLSVMLQSMEKILVLRVDPQCKRASLEIRRKCPMSGAYP